MNNFLKVFAALLISGCFTEIAVNAFKVQTNVKADHDCSCTGFIAKAKECGWEDKSCPSGNYDNYVYWCEKLNAFRDAKRTGDTPATYVRTLTCQSYLSRNERNAIFANEKPAPTPKYFYSIEDLDSKVPLSTAPVTSIDWTSEFGDVKNQNPCGSCWA